MKTYTYDYSLSYNGRVEKRDVFSFYGELSETHEAHEAKIREITNQLKYEFMEATQLPLARKQHIVICVERVY